MDKPLEVQSTISILNNSTNEQIAVASLPESIRNEIHTLDNFRQDHNNLLYKGELLNLAIQMKSMQIEKLIKDHLNEKLEKPEIPENSDGANNYSNELTSDDSATI